MRASDLKKLAVETDERSARLSAEFAESAAARGLIDVSYGFADSSMGRLFVAVTRRGLVRLEYPGRSLDEELEELARRVSPRILESARGTEEVRRELDEYFEGRRRRFDVPVDLSLTKGFSRRVLRAAARIPFGTVATHRAVYTGGGLGGYTGGLDRKVTLLRLEGVLQGP